MYYPLQQRPYQTTDLLNAMDFGPELHGFLCTKVQIMDKNKEKSFYYTSIGI
jgi:hypothetical protein